MKSTFAATIFLLAGLCEPTFADTTSAEINGCTLVGPAIDAPEDCKALRIAFRTEVNDCITEMKAAYDQSLGQATRNAPQSTRARLLVCEAATRRDLGLSDQ